MRSAFRDVAPAAAFAGGLALLCFGLSLIYLPLGVIAGGALVAGGAALYEVRASRRTQS